MISTSSSKSKTPLFFLLLALSLAAAPLVYLPGGEQTLVKLVVSTILVLMAAAAWSIGAIKKSSLSLRFDLDLGLWLAIVALAIIAGLTSADKIVALFGVYAHYQGLLSFAVLTIAFTLWKQVEWQPGFYKVFLTLLVIGGGIQAILALAQVGAGTLGFELLGVGEKSVRSAGTLGNPNIFGSYMVPIIPLAVALAQLVSGRYRRAAYAAAGFILLAALSTLSMSAWLAVLVMGLVLIIDRWRHGGLNRRFLFSLAVAAVLLTAFLFFTESGLTGLGIVGRLESAAGVSGSAGSRIQLWKAGARLVAERPVFGWGPDSFRVVAPGPGLLSGVIELAAHPHNLLLEFAVNLGVPAALLLLVLFGSSLARFWRRPRADGIQRWSADIGLWLGAAIIGQLVITLTQSLNFIPFLLFLALLAAQAGSAPGRTLKTVRLPLPAGYGMVAVALSLVVLASWAGWRSVAAESAYRLGFKASEMEAPPVALTERAIRLNPYAVVYRYRLARIYLARVEIDPDDKDYIQGLAEVEAGRAVRPLDPTFLMIEARLHQHSQAENGSKAAIAAAEEALLLHPRSFAVRRILGDLNMVGREYETAAEHYAHAVNSNPGSNYVWLRLGLARYNARDRAGALAAYREAWHLRQSRTAGFMIDLIEARELQEKGTPEALRRAIELGKKLLRSHPDSLTAKLIVADSYFKLGEYATAARDYQEAAAERPDSFYVWYQAARALDAIGDELSALEAYREAVNIRPASEEAWREIERIEQKLGVVSE